MKLLPFALLAITLSATQPALAAPEPAKAATCNACHTPDKARVGPAYKDIAARYASDPNAVTSLADKIRKGGTGVWGKLTMPPNPGLSDTETRQLAEWVMGHR